MPGWRIAWPAVADSIAKPKVDPSHVGLGFVDVLFALVVGQILAPLSEWSKISQIGWTHLGVALVLTLTSWIGYHRSRNGPRFQIHFPNLPLLTFMLDVLMVIAYSLTVTTADLGLGRHQAVTALPEALLVTVSFLLYAAWDEANRRINASADYEAAYKKALKDKVLIEDQWPTKPEDRERSHRRRVVTLVFIPLVAAVLLVDLLVRTGGTVTTAWVMAIDCSLIVLLILFRIFKERPLEIEPYCVICRGSRAKLE